MNLRAAGAVTAAAYVGTIYAANWAITRYGIVPVGLGLHAPAGVYFAGLAFTLRDLTQDWLGRRWVIVCILAGAAASWTVADGRIALASAIAFLTSELADFAVYTPMRDRGWLRAVAASNAVGLVIDSALFLWIAFGSLTLIWGQIVGKTWVTLLAVAVLAGGRHVVSREPVDARGA